MIKNLKELYEFYNEKYIDLIYLYCIKNNLPIKRRNISVRLELD